MDIVNVRSNQMCIILGRQVAQVTTCRTLVLY